MRPLNDPSQGGTPTDAELAFAAGLLDELLHRIEVGNINAAECPRPGRRTFLVSHAWIDGAVIRLVYTAPPSGRTWGLARDTRRSLIGPSPWNEADNPALYYYLLDLEEEWPGGISAEPGENLDQVWWRGYPLDNLYQYKSDIPESHQYTAPPPDPSWIDRTPPVLNEPRRYADPEGPLPPGVAGG